MERFHCDILLNPVRCLFGLPYFARKKTKTHPNTNLLRIFKSRKKIFISRCGESFLSKDIIHTSELSQNYETKLCTR